MAYISKRNRRREKEKQIAAQKMGQLGQAPTGWQAFAQETTQIDPADEWSFDVYAICAKLNP